MACANGGIDSTGVSSPLINTKIIMKKNIMNIACCIVSEKLEIISPKLDIDSVKTIALA